jgi:hypothetical protein
MTTEHALQVLNERQKTHGDFRDTARIAQKLKTAVFVDSSELSPVQQESLDMILTKIARILSGNPNERDDWKDIAGYATLAVDFINHDD